ncbi:MAG: hypothetical protein IIT56_13895, partial [Bacteroidales bacterium]|nr:hypothetical protein [Bacteroidales bacterium]
AYPAKFRRNALAVQHILKRKRLVICAVAGEAEMVDFFTSLIRLSPGYEYSTVLSVILLTVQPSIFPLEK